MAKHESIAASTSYLKALYTWATVTSTVPSLHFDGLLPTCCCYGCIMRDVRKPLPLYSGRGNHVRENTNLMLKQNVVQDSGHFQLRAGKSSDNKNEEDKFQTLTDYNFCIKRCTSPSSPAGNGSVEMARTTQSNIYDYPQEQKCTRNRLSYPAQESSLTTSSQLFMQVPGDEANVDFDEKHDIASTKSFQNIADQNHAICCCGMCLSSLCVQSMRQTKIPDYVEGQSISKAAADVDTSKFEDYSLSAVVERACYLPKPIVQEPETQEPATGCIQADDVVVPQNEHNFRNLNFVEASRLNDGDHLECNIPYLCCNDNSVQTSALDQINSSPNHFSVDCVDEFPPQFWWPDHNMLPSLAFSSDRKETFLQLAVSCGNIMENNQIGYPHPNSSLDFLPIMESGLQLSPSEIDLQSGHSLKPEILWLDTKVFHRTSEENKFRDQQVLGPGKCYKNPRGKRPHEIMRTLTAEYKLSKNEAAIFCGKQGSENQDQGETWKEFSVQECSQSPLQNTMGLQTVNSDFSIVYDKQSGISTGTSGIEMTFSDGGKDGLLCSDSNVKVGWDSNAAFVPERKVSKEKCLKSSPVLRFHNCLHESGIQTIPRNKHRNRAKKASVKQVSYADDHLTQDLSDDFSQVAVAPNYPPNYDSGTEVDQGFNTRSLQSNFASKKQLMQLTAEEILVTRGKLLRCNLDNMTGNIHMATKCDTLQENMVKDLVIVPADKTVSFRSMEYSGDSIADARHNHSILSSHVVFQYPYYVDDIFGEQLKVLEGKTTTPRLYI